MASHRRGAPPTPNGIRLAWIVTGLLALLAAPALAQDNVLDLRVVEFDSEPTITYQNFIYDRFFNGGKIIVEALHLRIPVADYRELSVGAGYRIAEHGDLQVYAIGHIGFGSDSSYFQPAALIVDGKGRWTGSFFGQLYAPLEDGGVRAWLVDPLEVQYAAVGRVSVGGAAYLYKAVSAPWLRKVGTKVSVADRYGASEFRVTRASDGLDSHWEMQFRRIVVF
jgi:hypothetical protein